MPANTCFAILSYRWKCVLPGPASGIRTRNPVVLNEVRHCYGTSLLGSQLKNQPRQQAAGGVSKTEALERESNPPLINSQVSPNEVAPTYGTEFLSTNWGNKRPASISCSTN
jgi:hypothetical protein